MAAPLIPNPIRKALSSMKQSGVRSLLMGGQACIFYGGAEFSRDVDLLIATDDISLRRLKAALDDLGAKLIAVPDFDARHLERGHALHFRCTHPDADGLRIDVMSKLRGVDAFDVLWERRTTAVLEDGLEVDLMSLPDLVKAKKTQRDKDWPMITRLVDASYFTNKAAPSDEQLDFWLRELRTPALLCAVAVAHHGKAESLAADRHCLRAALVNDANAVRAALRDEEEAERAADEAYWRPLKRDLESMRRSTMRKNS